MHEHNIDFHVSGILTNPEQQWGQIKKTAMGNKRVAFRKLDVDWKKYNTKDYLFTHDTACCSVETEENGYWITPPCWELVNANGNAWTTPVLLASFKTFIGGDNFCFTEGTRVLMSDGTYKPIEDIRVGDIVINAKGEKDVVSNIFCHSYSGKMVTVKHHDILSRKLTSTADHPFFVYQDRGTSAVSGKAINPQRASEHPNYEDVGMAPGERKGNITESRWGHPQYVNADSLDNERNVLIHPIPECVVENDEINQNRAYLIGWFLAEGSYIGKTKGIQIALSKNEKDIADKICALLEQEFPEKCLSGIVNAKDKDSFAANAKFKRASYVVMKNSKTGEDSWIVLNYYSSSANTFFRKWCNEYSWAKCLPEEAIWLPLNLQRIIFMQYMNGDGCCKIKSKGATVSSKSQKLIQQMRLIAIRLGAFPVYREIGVLSKYTNEILKDGYPVFVDPTTNKISRPGYQLDFNCNDWHILSGCEKPKHSAYSTRFENNFVFRFEKEETQVENITVYNFETQNDHSYVAEGVAVHNCEHIQIPALSKGKILDAIARPVVHHSEKYGDAHIYYVDLLIATSRKHTNLIERIESGKLRTLSMGCIAEATQCSICGKIIGDNDKNCEHIDKHLGQMVTCQDGKERICAELCGCCDENGNYVENSNRFIECSFVENPAFKGAVVNAFVETDEIKTAREEEKDELSKLFEGNLFDRLKVADTNGKIALKITKEIGKIERISEKIIDEM